MVIKFDSFNRRKPIVDIQKSFMIKKKKIQLHKVKQANEKHKHRELVSVK